VFEYSLNPFIYPVRLYIAGSGSSISDVTVDANANIIVTSQLPADLSADSPVDQQQVNLTTTLAINEPPPQSLWAQPLSPAPTTNQQSHERTELDVLAPPAAFGAELKDPNPESTRSPEETAPNTAFIVFQDTLEAGTEVSSPFHLDGPSSIGHSPLLTSQSSPSTLSGEPSVTASPRPGNSSHMCPHCCVSFSYRHQLRRHLDKVHFQTFVCETCTAKGCTTSFTLKADLKRHKRTVHSNTETKASFACPYPSCTKAYNRDDNLRKHIRIKHNGEPRMGTA